jgi:hypothetical protein
VERRDRAMLADIIESVFHPTEIVEAGGPYLDRRSMSGRVMMADWERCLGMRLACKYKRRPGFGLHDLSLCIAQTAPKRLGKQESSVLVSNLCAVARTVVFAPVEADLDWHALFADCGFAADARASRRVTRRVAGRLAEATEMIVFRPIKEWR